MSKIRYCKRCGNPLAEKSRFCDNCGAPAEAAAGSGQSGRGQRPVNPDADGRQNQRPVRPNENGRQNQRPAGQDGNIRREQRPSGQSGNIRQNQRTSGQNRNIRQNQRPAGQDGNVRREQRPSGQNGNFRQNQRPSGQNPNARQIPPYEAEKRRERYRQQEIEKDWQQSWDRIHDEEEDAGFTPLQYVLIGLIVILLVVLIVFCAFWIFGRSDKKSDAQRNSVQNAAVTTEQMQDQKADAIEILDGGGTQVQTEAQTVKQTESELQTEKQTEAAQDTVINYSEFALTIPASWKGKYGITQTGDSYTFYHQGSKAQGYAGEFFTITCYKDTLYKQLPNAQVLGLGDGTAYVFTVPSGVMYPQDNQTVAEEYKRMNLDFGGISSRFRMLVSGEGPKETEPQQIIEIQENPNQQVQVQESANQQSEAQQTSSGGGYLAESSSRALTDADVAGMSSEDMQMAINEIYARHGRRFSSESIQSYFDSQSWYSGTVAPEEFSESVFSATEAQNIQFLLNKMGAQ